MGASCLPGKLYGGWPQAAHPVPRLSWGNERSGGRRHREAHGWARGAPAAAGAARSAPPGRGGGTPGSGGAGRAPGAEKCPPLSPPEGRTALSASPFPSLDPYPAIYVCMCIYILFSAWLCLTPSGTFSGSGRRFLPQELCRNNQSNVCLRLLRWCSPTARLNPARLFLLVYFSLVVLWSSVNKLPVIYLNPFWRQKQKQQMPVLLPLFSPPPSPPPPRSSRRVGGQLRSAALPRWWLPGEANVLFLEYFYALHGRKKGSALHEHRETPGWRNSSAPQSRSSGLPAFAGRGGRTGGVCVCTAPLSLGET